MSPGAETRYARRRRPELPPSSAVVTIAVIRSRSAAGRQGEACGKTTSFNPLSRSGTPVPPPRATTLSADGTVAASNPGHTTVA